MDEIKKAWMFNHWVEDKNDWYELSKANGILIGSFTNPEAAQKMVSDEGKVVSTDEEFEETSRMVKEVNLDELGAAVMQNSPSNSKKRKRKILKK